MRQVTVLFLLPFPPFPCFCGWFAFPEPHFQIQIAAPYSGSALAVQSFPSPQPPPPQSAVDPPERSCEGSIPSHASDSQESTLARLGIGSPSCCAAL